MSIKIVVFLIIGIFSAGTIAEGVPDPHIPVYFYLYLDKDDKLYPYGIDTPAEKPYLFEGMKYL